MVAKPEWNEHIFYDLLIELRAGKRHLDLGCGRGPRAPELRAVDARSDEASWVGVDPCIESLVNHRRGLKVCAQGERLPFSENSFDIVSSDMVFEHLLDPAAALREISRVLRGGAGSGAHRVREAR